MTNNPKYLALCVTLITVVIIGGSFIDLAVGADPTRVISIITIVLASTVTPLFAITRIGKVEESVTDATAKASVASDKAQMAASNAGVAADKASKALNGGLNAQIAGVLHQVLDERAAATVPPNLPPSG